MSGNTILANASLSEQATRPNSAPARRLIAAGVKRGSGPLTIEAAGLHLDAATHARAAIALLDAAAAQALAVGNRIDAKACKALADGVRTELERRAA